MENNQTLDEIKKLLQDVVTKVDQQNEEIKKLENRMFAVEQIKNNKSEGISIEKSQTDLQRQEINLVESLEKADREERMNKGNFEERLGGQWFAKIGIAVIFIGIALFLKYAFDNNWINEAWRVIIGISSGVGLLAVGEMLIKKYFNYGQIIIGGGIAILYLSIFVAFNFYHLIPSFIAFIAMLAITLTAIFLSLRHDAMSLIIVAIVGGFASPLLCSPVVNNQVVLFSYMLILDLTIFSVSLFKKWRQLNLIGFVGTILLSIVWYGQFYSIKQLPVTIFFWTLFFLIYSIAPLLYNLYRKEISAGEEQLLTLFAGLVYFGSVYGLMNPKYHAWMGVFALILGLYYLIWAWFTRTVSPQDEKLYGFLAFLSAGFIAVAIPIQFKYYTITIGWMIEALLLLYIGAKQVSERVLNSDEEKQNIVIAFGLVVSLLAVIRLLFVDSVRIMQNEIFFINKRFGIFLFVILCFYSAGYIFSKCIRVQVSQKQIMNTKDVMVVMLIVANFLTIFAISKEIVNYHNREINVLTIEQNSLIVNNVKYKNNSSAIYSDASYKKLDEKIENVNYRSSIVLSLFWLLYAIILLAIGFAGSYKAIRIGGIVLLMFSILKLFFYDLWQLGTLYRIISSISLGIVLLFISFTYQKYKEKLKEVI